MLYLLGLISYRRFRPCPLARIDKRPGVTIGILRNWCLVFIGNFPGALTVAVMMAVIFTFGFTVEPDAVGKRSAGSAKPHDRLCRAWRGRDAHAFYSRDAVQLDGFDRRRRRDDLDDRSRQSARHVDADHGVLLHDLRAFGREHVPVPFGPDARRQFLDRGLLLWNEIPTVLGNLIGGLTFIGLTLYTTHVRTGAQARRFGSAARRLPNKV